MEKQSIIKTALLAGRDEIAILIAALHENPRFNVQHKIDLAKGYFVVDVWVDGINHCYLSSANSWPGDHYLLEKLQVTITKLREVCREFNISMGSRKTHTIDASNDAAPNVVHFPTTPVPPAVQLRSGNIFDYANIGEMQFDIEDIAHALSNICRFNGHTREFYSVAQHSVLVSSIVPEEHALAALLHDAAEAYCGDVVSPLKQLLPVYQSILNTVEQQLFKSIGLEWPVAACVKEADLTILATEVRDLMMPHDHHWANLKRFTPTDETIHALPPGGAKALFLDCYYSLQSKAAALAANA